MINTVLIAIMLVFSLSLRGMEGLPPTALYFDKQISNLEKDDPDSFETLNNGFEAFNEALGESEVPGAQKDWRKELWLYGRITIEPTMFDTQSKIDWLNDHTTNKTFNEHQNKQYEIELLRGILKNCFIDSPEEPINIENLNDSGKIILAQALLSNLVYLAFSKRKVPVRIFEQFQTITDQDKTIAKQIKRQIDLLHQIIPDSNQDDVFLEGDKIGSFVQNLFKNADANLSGLKDVSRISRILNVLKRIAAKNFKVQWLALNAHLSRPLRLFVNNVGKLIAIPATYALIVLIATLAGPPSTRSQMFRNVFASGILATAFGLWPTLLYKTLTSKNW